MVDFSCFQSFQREVQDHLPLIREAIQSGNAEKLRQLAHRLKGTAANIGASAVAESCYALEKLGRSSTVQGAPALIQELQERYEQTVALFEQMKEKRP